MDFESNLPSIGILMGTYNGEKFIAEQLDSIATQTHPNWRLIASDDGSVDETLNILAQYQKAWGEQKLEIRQGPARGFSANFLSLACDASIDADYYAFADQDDVWQPEKFAVAINYLAKQDPAIPTVYCGRTAYVDDNLKPKGFSPLFIYPTRFRNALVQSIAGGNTMVFNRAAKKLLEAAGVLEVVSDDWWLYLLIMGAGGKVYYHAEPYVLYRQHADSLIGGNNSLVASAERIVLGIRGRFRYWNDIHVIALDQCRHLLTSNATEILDLFLRLRDSHFIHRCRMIEVCGLYRQTRRGSISLLIAAALKKV